MCVRQITLLNILASRPPEICYAGICIFPFTPTLAAPPLNLSCCIISILVCFLLNNHTHSTPGFTSKQASLHP